MGKSAFFVFSSDHGVPKVASQQTTQNIPSKSRKMVAFPRPARVSNDIKAGVPVLDFLPDSSSYRRA